MTQQELADQAGVDLKTVYNLESGTRWPIAKNRAAVSAALRWEGDALAAILAGRDPAETGNGAPDDREIAMRQAAEQLGLNLDDIMERLWRRAHEAERLLPPGVLPPGMMIYPEDRQLAAKWDQLAASTYADDQPMTIEVLVSASALWEGIARQRERDGTTAAGLIRPLARA